MIIQCSSVRHRQTIIRDALLSIGTSNEEMASQDHHLHLCDTDTENTSVLVNHLNIFFLFSPDTFMVITFAGALRQALVCCVSLNTELFRYADSKHCRAALSHVAA